MTKHHDFRPDRSAIAAPRRGHPPTGHCAICGRSGTQGVNGSWRHSPRRKKHPLNEPKSRAVRTSPEGVRRPAYAYAWQDPATSRYTPASDPSGDLERQPLAGFGGPAYRYIRAADHLPTYAQIADDPDPLALVKLFGGPGTWWIAAYDPDTRTAYGVAELSEREIGSFSMAELVEARIPPFRLPVERDLSWSPKPISEIVGKSRSWPHASDPVKDQLVAKLRPDHLRTSGKMTAIIAFVLGEKGWTSPAIDELIVTSDGFVLAQHEGEVGANDMIGTEADLNRNLLGVIEAAGLTEEEVAAFGRLQRARIVRYGARRG